MKLFGFLDVGIIDILDIAVVAALLFYFYKLLRNTVAVYIFVGIVMVYIVGKITEVLQMRMLSGILGNFTRVGSFALIVVFQEEIRRLLLLLGSSSFSKRKGLGRLFRFSQGKKSEINVTALIEACRVLSSQKTGLLVVIERETPLDHLMRTGDKMALELDAKVLELFFQKTSPLHDGAIIVRDNKIVATRVILPISQSMNIPGRYGLRHRAAIGATEKTDALALVVSEETGYISYIKTGNFVPYDSIEALETRLRADMSGD